jgi:recombination protein U
MSTAKAKAHGATWEAYVRAENTHLARIGKALVVKVPEDLRPVRRLKDGHVQAVYAGKAYCDYMGTLQGGRAVTFDAKATLSETSFPFSNIADHQLEIMTTVARLGGIAFVYVLSGLQDKYVLPVNADGVIAGVTDRKSFPFDEHFRKPTGETWLDTLERLMRE